MRSTKLASTSSTGAATGERSNFVDDVPLVMPALATVTGTRAAGVAVAIAMLVAPAATMMTAAAAIGTAAAVTGLSISYHFDLPAGHATALVASGMSVLAVSFRRRAVAGGIRLARTAPLPDWTSWRVSTSAKTGRGRMGRWRRPDAAPCRSPMPCARQRAGYRRRRPRNLGISEQPF